MEKIWFLGSMGGDRYSRRGHAVAIMCGRVMSPSDGGAVFLCIYHIFARLRSSPANQSAVLPPSSCGSVRVHPDSRPHQSAKGVPFGVCAGIWSRFLYKAYSAWIFVSGLRCCSHSGILSDSILILAALIFFRTLMQCLIVAKFGLELTCWSWSWENWCIFR